LGNRGVKTECFIDRCGESGELREGVRIKAVRGTER
jgi:hypothetical protein